MAFDAIMMVHGWTYGRSKPQDFNLKMEKICEHIDHICQIAGNARHSAIGSDLDGAFGKEQCPSDLETIADLPGLAQLPHFEAATPDLVDASTLLPQRGAQGAPAEARRASQ